MVAATNKNSAPARAALAIVLTAIIAAVFFTAAASACSVFALTARDTTVLGQNLDLDPPFPGCVVVSPRGIEKAVLPWQGNGPAPYWGEGPSWTSRYASVTFTCWGRDFIEGGMNEAGLMIDQANLTAVYPAPDDRPGVSPAQWMQFQLDNYATVGEVLAHLDDLRLDGEEWHFIVADAGGDCAVIEYLDSAALVYSGSAVEVCALTNTEHRRALSHIAMDAAFGGGVDIAAGGDSYGRFARMAAFMRDYDPARSGAIGGYAFTILDEVRAYDTLRSVVYDSGRKRVSWRTPGNPDTRWLDFESLALEEGSAAAMLGVEEGGPGDASSLLEPWTVEANRLIVDGTVGARLRASRAAASLSSLEPAIDATVDHIAGHPARVATRAGESH